MRRITSELRNQPTAVVVAEGATSSKLMPGLPPKPTAEKPRTPTTATIPLMMAFIVATFVVAVLSLLTLGFAGVILGIGLLMSAFIASQYLLWGWWLGAAIRRSDDEEDAPGDSDP